MDINLYKKTISVTAAFCLVFCTLLFSGCNQPSADVSETAETVDKDSSEKETVSDKTDSDVSNKKSSSVKKTTSLNNTSKTDTVSKKKKTASVKKTASQSGDSTAVTQDDGYLESFSFLVKDNPSLPFDVDCEIGSNYITAILPAGTGLSSLKPTYSYTGGNVFASGKAVISGNTALDFSKNVTLTLGSEKMIVELSLMETGLPSVCISVDSNAAITDKTKYVNCRVVAAGGDYEKYPDYAFAKGQSLDVSGKIKGRGWTSWYYYPKKSYTLKLNTKKSLLGLSESKEWVLAANFADRSLIRNAVGMELAHNVGVEFVMDVRFVDLWINGEYVGNYQLIEKIEIEKDRVDITKFDPSLAPDQIGYIVETNGHNTVEEFKIWTNGLETDRPKLWQSLTDAITLDPISGDMFFKSNVYTSVFNVNKPSDSKLMQLSATERNKYLNYIYNYVNEMESAIKSRDYATASSYLDMNSMAKWYIVNELSMNTDSKLHASCYMYKDAGEKMKMGPLWDFDLGFGNGSYANENRVSTAYLDNSTWFKDLLAMPQFKAEVKRVWNESKSKIKSLPEFINKTGKMLSKSQEENYYIWSIDAPAEHTYQKTTEYLYDYKQQIDYLKAFTSNRIVYMNNKISTW